MKSTTKQWMRLIAVTCFTLAVIVSGGQWLGYKRQVEYGEKTSELVYGKQATLECRVIQEAPWVGFECVADRWGRFLVWWDDEYGNRHLIRDFNYSREVGELFANNPGRLVVTFQDVDGYTAQAEIVFSGFANRECTRDNGCLRVGA